jgi:hypothetical protein
MPTQKLMAVGAIAAIALGVLAKEAGAQSFKREKVIEIREGESYISPENKECRVLHYEIQNQNNGETRTQDIHSCIPRLQPVMARPIGRKLIIDGKTCRRFMFEIVDENNEKWFENKTICQHPPEIMSQ